MRGSSEGEMTNGCPVLILFVVKSTLIHDCLAETALHLTQLEVASPASFRAAGVLATASIRSNISICQRQQYISWSQAVSIVVVSDKHKGIQGIPRQTLGSGFVTSSFDPFQIFIGHLLSWWQQMEERKDKILGDKICRNYSPRI